MEMHVGPHRLWQRLGWTVGFTALSVLAGCAASPTAAAPAPRASTYTNPLLPSGPDPWITQVDGIYYYTHTVGDRITLWRTDNIANLARAQSVVVWTAPKTGPNAHSIWAPELHRIDGKWFLYYSATAGGFTDNAH